MSVDAKSAAILQNVEDLTGVTNISRLLSARYDLIFKPEVVLPQVQAEIFALKELIKTRFAVIAKELMDLAKSDERLAALSEDDKFAYVQNRLVPEINASAQLIRQKYPGAVEFLMGEDLNKASKKFVEKKTKTKNIKMSQFTKKNRK